MLTPSQLGLIFKLWNLGRAPTIYSRISRISLHMINWFYISHYLLRTEESKVPNSFPYVHCKLPYCFFSFLSFLCICNSVIQNQIFVHLWYFVMFFSHVLILQNCDNIWNLWLYILTWDSMVSYILFEDLWFYHFFWLYHITLYAYTIISLSNHL